MSGKKSLKEIKEIILKHNFQDIYNCRVLGDGVKNFEYIEDASQVIYGILDKIDSKLLEARTTTRQHGYNESHPVDQAKVKYKLTKSMSEDRMARLFVSYNFPYIGKVFDYQVPLKSKGQGRKNEAAIGKIDLVSTSEDKIFLLEFKKKEWRRDSILHAAMEIYTYSKRIAPQRFKEDFKDHLDNMNAPIIPCVFIFDNKDTNDSKQATEIRKAMLGELPHLTTLFTELHKRSGLEIVLIGDEIIERINDYENNGASFPNMEKKSCEWILPVTKIKLT